MRPTFAVINLSNLKKNYLNIRRKVKKSKVMAVVKANAYGHGLKEIVRKLNSLNKLKPEYYAVALSQEADELRKYDRRTPILVFEPFTSGELNLLFKNNLIPTVFTDAHLNMLRYAIRNHKEASKLIKPMKVHVKVDTGMNRLGVRYDEAFDFIKKLSGNKNFSIDGVYTHFATSDERDKSFANKQLKRFKQLLEKLKRNKISFGHAHAANSGAILDMPDSYLDIVRPGISLYGYYPSLETTESIHLYPVMSLYSVVNAVKYVYPDEGVSYGLLYRPKKKIKVAAVPIGYADGFNRALTNKARAIIKGKIYNQIGRVTMDRIMFEIGDDDIGIGDRVTLLGKYKNFKIDAWDLSKALGTIPYEITCGISSRVTRVYKN
jgi:alanine racemase